MSVGMTRENTKSNRKEINFFILVPVYKVEKYIHDCIKSVLNQTYPNFKLILVDDGSPDRSGDICDEYASMDDRITVIHQRNMGLIAARQTAIRYVKQLFELQNDFIVFLDSDDSLKKYALERISEIIAAYDCDMVIYGMDRVRDGKIMIPYNDIYRTNDIIKDKRTLYKRVFNSSEYNSLCRKAISASLLSDTDYSEYFHIVYGEDLLQSIAYYRDSRKVYFLNESLYNYTINPESLTHSVFNKNYQVDFTVGKCVFEFLHSENVFTSEDWVEYRTYCIRRLIDIILGITNIKVDSKRKRKYFEEIQKSEYFLRYIRGQEYNRGSLNLIGNVYVLFQKRIYWPIFIVCNLYHIIRIERR